MKKILKRIALVVTAGALCAMLFACAPSNVSKAEEKMAKQGYTVTDINASILGLLFDGVEGGIMAVDNEGESIVAVRFESVDDAKDAFKDWDDLLSKLGKEGTAVRDGKWVYSGTGDAIEDFTD